MTAVEADIGPIEVVYNLGANWRQDIEGYESQSSRWVGASERSACFASRQRRFHWEARGKGTLLVTSATAAMRGNDSVTPFGRDGRPADAVRTLSTNSHRKEFTSSIVIDGAVDAPDTLWKDVGSERFQQLRETRGMEHDGLMLPAKIADTYVHLAQQHRSVWTHEIDLRSFSDRAWWNH